MAEDQLLKLKESLLSRSSDTLDETRSEVDLSIASSANTVWLVSKKAIPLIIAGFGNSVKPTITFAFINLY